VAYAKRRVRDGGRLRFTGVYVDRAREGIGPPCPAPEMLAGRGGDDLQSST
jgi:hypothetical protein